MILSEFYPRVMKATGMGSNSALHEMVSYCAGNMARNLIFSKTARRCRNGLPNPHQTAA